MEILPKIDYNPLRNKEKTDPSLPIQITMKQIAVPASIAEVGLILRVCTTLHQINFSA